MSQCGSRCQNLKYHRLFECLEKVSDVQNTAFNSETEAENGKVVKTCAESESVGF